MKTFKELEGIAIQEIEEDKEMLAVAEIKERLIEIEATETILGKLKAQYQEMLGKPVDSVKLLPHCECCG